MLLLHGGFEHGETWAPQVPSLSANYRLIIPDRRGHGRTADVDGPITYELMANDTVGAARRARHRAGARRRVQRRRQHRDAAGARPP